MNRVRQQPFSFYCPNFALEGLRIVEQAAGHLRWEVDYPPSQPVGAGFKPHWRPQVAKLPSFGRYSLETLPYLTLPFTVILHSEIFPMSCGVQVEYKMRPQHRHRTKNTTRLHRSTNCLGMALQETVGDRHRLESHQHKPPARLVKPFAPIPWPCTAAPRLP